jgi:UDP-N-acetylmuramate: L-alanyl-gamma-D-glutamyl-meso-diaminopimelate ligase
MIDLIKNKIPTDVQTIHMIAVCGTAMGALACLLKDLGYGITGSDQTVYPPMSDFLRAKGIQITEGYDAKNLDYGPDLVVVGNAVSKNNPEVVRMLSLGLSFCSMPQAVCRFLAAGKRRLIVTGTHGKTTTSSLIAWLLFSAKLDPSYMIGGILKNFDSNYRIGAGEFTVLEGDEYDTAFFDKGPKFLHYQQDVAVVTSIEFDHADIFNDLDHIKSAFTKFLQKIPASSLLIGYDGDSVISQLIGRAACKVQRYGRDKISKWMLGEVQIKPPVTYFEVLKDQGLFGKFKMAMVGGHNLLNALAAIAVVESLGVSQTSLAQGLASFKGIKRRQELRGIRKGISVIDDFAHHPTAVKETIQAVKAFYPHGRLIAVFEPRTNTSMRDIFQDVYPKVFDNADVVCIRKPPLLIKIPENERFSSKKLVSDLKQRAVDAYYFEETSDIVEFIPQIAKSGDVILVMSNGGFDNIHIKLLERLEQ